MTIKILSTTQLDPIDLGKPPQLTTVKQEEKPGTSLGKPEWPWGVSKANGEQKERQEEAMVREVGDSDLNGFTPLKRQKHQNKTRLLSSPVGPTLIHVGL